MKHCCAKWGLEKLTPSLFKKIKAANTHILIIPLKRNGFISPQNRLDDWIRKQDEMEITIRNNTQKVQ